MKRASSLRLSRPKPIGRSWVALGRFSWTLAISVHRPERRVGGRGLVLGSPADGRDDVLVARTPADTARDGGPDLGLRRVGVLVQERAGGHQHPGGAEAALQRVVLVEALLDRVELAVHLERL